MDTQLPWLQSSSLCSWLSLLNETYHLPTVPQCHSNNHQILADLRPSQQKSQHQCHSIPNSQGSLHRFFSQHLHKFLVSVLCYGPEMRGKRHHNRNAIMKQRTTPCCGKRHIHFTRYWGHFFFTSSQNYVGEFNGRQRANSPILLSSNSHVSSSIELKRKLSATLIFL